MEAASADLLPHANDFRRKILKEQLEIRRLEKELAYWLKFSGNAVLHPPRVEFIISLLGDQKEKAEERLALWQTCLERRDGQQAMCGHRGRHN